jgi:hypothetical protein
LNLRGSVHFAFCRFFVEVTMGSVLLETIYELRGSFPDVPLAPDVNVAELTASDSSPLYVTLPLGKVGQVSRNGRKYPRAAMESIVSAIMTRKVPGQKGHMRDEDRPYEFETPPVLWLGAKLESDGTVWGKGYVMPFANDVRDYVRAVKAANGRMATSIYGTGSQDSDGTVTDLTIESIDLVDPSRAGVELAASTPRITAETKQENAMKNKSSMQRMMNDLLEMGMKKSDVLKALAKKSEMSMDAFMKMWDDEEDDMPAEMFTALKGEMNTLKKNFNRPAQEATVDTENKTIIEQRDAIRVLTAQNAAMTEQLRDLQKVRELLGIAENVDVVLSLQNRITAQKLLEKENADLLQENIRASVAEAVKLEAARPMIVSLVEQQKPTRRSDISVALESVLNRTEVKEMLKLTMVQEMGQAHQPAPSGQQQTATFFEVPGY